MSTDRYARSFPAATGDVVTQGHADYCTAHGHAEWTRDGIPVERCARCNEPTDPGALGPDHVVMFTD